MLPRAQKNRPEIPGEPQRPVSRSGYRLASRFTLPKLSVEGRIDVYPRAVERTTVSGPSMATRRASSSCSSRSRFQPRAAEMNTL